MIELILERVEVEEATLDAELTKLREEITEVLDLPSLFSVTFRQADTKDDQFQQDMGVDRGNTRRDR